MWRKLEILSWILAATAFILAGFQWYRAVPGPSATVHSTTEAVAPVQPQDVEALATAADLIVRSDPFRVERRPSQVAYGSDPVKPSPGIEIPPPPPRPTLILAGIIGGPPWQAIIEGVPGRSGGVLVRTGDVISGLRIRAIGLDTVIVQGVDTIWRLTLKRPWH